MNFPQCFCTVPNLNLWITPTKILRQILADSFFEEKRPRQTIVKQFDISAEISKRFYSY